MLRLFSLCFFFFVRCELRLLCPNQRSFQGGRMKVCNNCTQQLADDANFCSRCGMNLRYPGQPGAGVKRKSNAWVIGIVIAVGAVLLIPVVGIVAAIAIPNLIRARISANETSAVRSIRVLNASLATYHELHQNQYPRDLSGLNDANLDAELARGQKFGYRFVYEAEDTDANGTLDAYTIHADPMVEDRTGIHHFFSDQTRLVRGSSGPAPASVQSPVLK